MIFDFFKIPMDWNKKEFKKKFNVLFKKKKKKYMLPIFCRNTPTNGLVNFQ